MPDEEIGRKIDFCDLYRQRQGKTNWKRMLGALNNPAVKDIFIEQDARVSGDELGAVKQAHEFLLQV